MCLTILKGMAVNNAVKTSQERWSVYSCLLRRWRPSHVNFLNLIDVLPPFQSSWALDVTRTLLIRALHQALLVDSLAPHILMTNVLIIMVKGINKMTKPFH